MSPRCSQCGELTKDCWCFQDTLMLDTCDNCGAHVRHCQCGKGGK